MTWGTRSKAQAATTHPDHQKVAARVDERWPNTVLNGRRDMAQQRANVESGVSQTLESLHLLEYSQDPEAGADAIDVGPDPMKWPELKAKLLEIDELMEAAARDGLSLEERRDVLGRIRKLFAAYGKELGRWYAFCGYYHAVADEMYARGEITAPQRHGYDWDGDHRLDDQRFDDLPHHERRPV